MSFILKISIDSMIQRSCAAVDSFFCTLQISTVSMLLSWLGFSDRLKASATTTVDRP